MTAHDALVANVLSKKEAIESWFETVERKEDLPLYSSVDIRDAGFKIAVVDTNLFPAGFNNLCGLALKDAEAPFYEAIQARVPGCKRILIITEEHTRNRWYLENVYVLQNLIANAGFEVSVASFLDVTPEQCDEFGYIELETAKDNVLKMHCLKHVLRKVEDETTDFDLIILNNDLTTGVPDILKNAEIPIYPSLNAGWHSRLKSHHFRVANDVIREFAERIGEDPWLFSCLHEVVESVDINEDASRDRLAEAAKRLFTAIQAKYDDYGITEKPFIFMKSDSGTYGMGVKAVESVDEILSLNRKARNNLSKGKSSQKIEQFILQEGVPSVNHVDDLVGEACVYQIANHFVGGFYRVNDKKSNRDNLNSQGMSFRKMCVTDSSCFYEKQDDCGVEPDPNIELYKILARLSGLAAHREIRELESQ